MKKISLLSILCLTMSFMSCSVFATALHKNETSLDQVVAVVNDDIITSTEYNRAMENIKTQLTQQNISLPSQDVLKKQVLNQLINKKLQTQLAKQAGIETAEGDVDAAISRIAKQNNISTDELYKQLANEGIKSADYRREIRDQITMQKLQQQEIAGKMTVSPQEINAYMRSHPLQLDGTKEYRIQDILVPVPDTPTPDDLQSAKARANQLVARINKGEDFNKIAQAESSGKNALQGGDLGYRQLPEIPSAFAEIVAKMQPKTIAGPIQTPNGFHIIELTDVRGATSKSAAPTRKQIENYLLEQKFEEAIQNWVSKLRSQAFISTKMA